jgi:DNA replication licensing factor MCM3
MQRLQVGFVGEFGYHKLSPRKLLSSYLNQLVCVYGIVTKCSLVHPKLTKSVHYCEATRKFSSRTYFDETDLQGVPTNSNAMPIKDEAENPLTTEIGLCSFVDNQRVTLQELPETAPPGQLPRSTGMLSQLH